MSNEAAINAKPAKKDQPRSLLSPKTAKASKMPYTGSRLKERLTVKAVNFFNALAESWKASTEQNQPSIKSHIQSFRLGII